MSTLRVATNSIQENLIQQLNSNQRTLVTLQNQLATGRKVTMPEDDPDVMGRTMRSETEKSQLVQFNTNNIQAESIIKSSSLHLEEIRNLADLALGIANSVGDTTRDVEIEGYQNQLDEILNQAVDMANGTFDGEYLFAGVNHGTAPFSIDEGVAGDPTDDDIVYSGTPFDPTDPDYEQAEVYVGSNTKIAPRLDPQYNDDIQTMLKGLLDLRNAFDSTSFSSSDVTQIASRIEAADDSIVVAESDLITKQMRLELATETDKSLFNQLDETIAAEVGVDLTELSVKLKQSETAYEAALSSASTILNISLLNYI